MTLWRLTSSSRAIAPCVFWPPAKRRAACCRRSSRARKSRRDAPWVAMPPWYTRDTGMSLYYARLSRSRLHPYGAPAASLTLAEVALRFTRDTIAQDRQSYQMFLASGIKDSEIRDGSLGLGRVNCCGGPTEG